MLDSIRVLRGIAALSVVLFHFQATLASASGLSVPFASVVRHGGTFGVSLFFVISGFVIMMATERESLKPGAFMARRLFRILPLATLATLLCYMVKMGLTLDVTPNWIELVQSLFFLPLQNHGPPFYGYRVLPVQWTLTYELIFYVLFAMALCVSRRYRLELAMGLLMSMVFGLQGVYGHWVLDVYQAPLATGNGSFVGLRSLLANPIFMFFVIGMWMERLHGSVKRFTFSTLWPLFLAGMAVIGLVVLSFLLDFGVQGLSIGVFVLLLLNERHISASRWLQGFKYLGDISYSVYLLHPIVLLVLEWFIVGSGSVFGLHGFYKLCLLLAITVFLSGLSYRFVEKPAMRQAKRIFA